MPRLLQDLLFDQASSRAAQAALIDGRDSFTYRQLADLVREFARGLLSLGIEPGDRVGVYLEKRVEAVVAMFGTAAAGACFVPLNPLFRARHASYILGDCNAKVLVTSTARLMNVQDVLHTCTDLRSIVLVDDTVPTFSAELELCSWDRLLQEARSSKYAYHRRTEDDRAAIFYTSGSTGMPKGVVLSHRNMALGARSVCEYLDNSPEDRILAALPLSFDAGFSQLTTGFLSGAQVVLLNYLLPRDVINAMVQHDITGLTGVPTLFSQLVEVPWPEGAVTNLRYLASTGGVMPATTLERLRSQLPNTPIFLMYGLTEAFRSTFLPPEEIDRRPGSIGKAIPNAEIIVVDSDGRVCGPGESGELVHCGPLVAKGYWNDLERTAERFRPFPSQGSGPRKQEIAVWSGDTVRMDQDGFLYFMGRQDDMIKTSGYRVSPSEVEEVLYETDEVVEAAVVGAPHPTLGEGIVAIVKSRDGCEPDVERLLQVCRRELPAYMVPKAVRVRNYLPLTANGKVDRQSLRAEVHDIFAGADST